jgi:hypothetical protein
MPCEVATVQKADSHVSANEAAVTASAAAAIRTRFARSASTSAPAGVWATISAAVAIDMTTPMLASSQRLSTRR